MKRILAIAILIVVSFAIYAQSNLDSLIRALPQTPDSKKIEIYQAIILQLWLNHPDSAMQFARDAVVLARKLEDPRSRAIAARLLGGTHYYKGNYDSTIKYSHESYDMAEALQDSSLMTSAMNNVGLAYYNVGSYPESLEFLLRALNLKTRIRQEYGMSQTLNNIGLVYTELKDYERAREYFNRAIAIATTIDDKNQVLYSLNNIGFTYLDEGQLEVAKSFFWRAHELGAKIDNKVWHSSTLSGLGQLYLKKDSINLSKQYFRQSIALGQEIDDQSGIAENYSFFGRIFLQQNKRDSAMYFVRRSQAIAEEIGDKDLMMVNYGLLKDIHQRAKRYDSALFYQSQFIALQDSVFGKNLARSIKDIQLTIEREQAQSQLAAKDVQIRKITVQTYILVGLVVLALVIFIFLLKSYRAEKRLTNDLAKTNEEITRQKEEIHSQRDELALSHAELESAKEVIQQKNNELSKLNNQLQNTVDERTRQLELANKELKVVNLELDNFIYRSSHDIRGPLVRLLGICHVALIDVQDEKAREYLNMFYDAAQQLNEIFDRLKIVSNINEMKVEPVLIKFEDVLAQVLDKLQSMNGFSEIEILREDKVDQWYSDPFLLDLILVNMIENSIRFRKPDAQARKFVKIRTLRNGKNLHMRIIDNGIGIKEPDLDNLYKMFSKTAREHRNIGLGLYIVKQCINKLNGSISLVENTEGLTEFEIVHPLMNPN